MIKIPCQFSKHSGPMATGEHRITFDIQPEFASMLYDALRELTSNPNGILHFDQIKSTKEGQQLLAETQDEQRLRYNKKIYSLIDEVGMHTQVKPEMVKAQIKAILINEGKIKESLSELTEENQLETIQRLERIIEDGE